MQMIATLCVLLDDPKLKAIAISPQSDKWFVNTDDLTGEYLELANATEKDGKIKVLGILFGPDEVVK